MKTILFFTPVLVSGGAEKTIKNLIEYFHLYHPDYNVYECVMHFDKDVDVPEYVIPLRNDTIAEKNKIKKGFKKALQIIELRKIKKEYRVDTCVSFLPGADIVNVLSKTGEKVVMSLRNNPNNVLDNASSLYHRFFRHAVKNCDYIISLSEYVRREAVRSYEIPESKIETIYNPIPMKEKANEPLQYKEIRDKGKRIIVTAGRLTEQKGQWHLLKAFREVLRKKDDIVLFILGRGPLEQDLKKLTAELDIEKDVVFTGFVSNASDYIASADAFIFPSVFEGLGNVLIETLAVGTPIISSDCPFGPREILAPGIKSGRIDSIEFAEYGVLVPAGSREIEDRLTNDEICLANAIIDVVYNKETLTHYKSKSFERAGSFEPEVIIEKWNQVL